MLKVFWTIMVLCLAACGGNGKDDFGGGDPSAKDKDTPEITPKVESEAMPVPDSGVPAADTGTPTPSIYPCTPDKQFCDGTKIRLCSASGYDSTLVEECALKDHGLVKYKCVPCASGPACEFNGTMLDAKFGEGIAQGFDVKMQTPTCPQTIINYSASGSRTTTYGYDYLQLHLGTSAQTTSALYVDLKTHLGTKPVYEIAHDYSYGTGCSIRVRTPYVNKYYINCCDPQSTTKTMPPANGIFTISSENIDGVFNEYRSTNPQFQGSMYGWSYNVKIDGYLSNDGCLTWKKFIMDASGVVVP